MRLATVIAVSIGSALALSGDEPASKKPGQQDVIKISRETTFITEPLTSDGFPDYRAYLNGKMSEGVSSINNADIYYWRAMGNADGNVEYRKQMEKYWGVSLFDPNRRQLVNISKFAEQKGIQGAAAKALFEQQGRSGDAPWTEKDMPLIAEWVQLNQAPLAIAVEGTKKDQYFRPVVGGEREMLIMTLLPDIQGSRSIARLLSARAMLRLGRGDVAGARQDILAMHRLARHINRGWTLIEMLVGAAIDSMASHTEQQMLQHAELSADELTAYRTELAKLERFDRFAEILDQGERLSSLDAITHFADTSTEDGDVADAFGVLDLRMAPGAGVGGAVQKWLLQNAIDWNVVMIVMNQEYDRIVTAAKLPDRWERNAAFEKQTADLKQVADTMRDPTSMLKAVFLGAEERSKRIGNMLTALLLPPAAQADEAQTRVNGRSDVTQVGIALLAYRADTGTLPESLDALVPKYIDAIPKDLYHGRDLKYKVRDGEFAVYSVGQNLKDDGGLTFGDVPGMQTDDLVFRSLEWFTPVEEK